MQATIYHNRTCGTSRNTLALIRAAGIEPTVVEYLTQPPAAADLQKMIADAGLTVREAIRHKEKWFADLQLDRAELSDDDLIAAMLAHPILINRPFVVTPLGARLCRPAELVLEILPEQAAG